MVVMKKKGSKDNKICIDIYMVVYIILFCVYIERMKVGFCVATWILFGIILLDNLSLGVYLFNFLSFNLYVFFGHILNHPFVCVYDR